MHNSRKARLLVISLLLIVTLLAPMLAHGQDDPDDEVDFGVDGLILGQAQGDKVEWGVWTAAEGYRTIGWVWLNTETGQITNCSVPEDEQVLSRAEFCAAIGLTAPASPPAADTAGATNTETGTDTTTTTTTTEGEDTGTTTITTQNYIAVDPSEIVVPELDGDVMQEALAEDMIEWGVWNAETGYTTLGWVWVTESGSVTGCSVPEDQENPLMTAAQFCKYVGGPLPLIPVTVPVVVDDGEAPAAAAPPANPAEPVTVPAIEGKIMKQNLGTQTEWGFWTSEDGYTTLGWIWYDNGQRRCSIPENNPVLTEAQLCAFVDAQQAGDE